MKSTNINWRRRFHQAAFYINLKRDAKATCLFGCAQGQALQSPKYFTVWLSVRLELTVTNRQHWTYAESNSQNCLTPNQFLVKTSLTSNDSGCYW